MTTAIAPVPLRRNRDFLILWSSQFLSTVGTRVTSVALPLLVLTTTGSPAQTGVVAFAQTLPFLVVFLPAGALVDRLDRKLVMRVSDAARAAAIATLVIAIAADRITLGHLALVAFVEGTGFVFFELAEVAALPHLVPPVQLPAAIAQNQARQQGGSLLGQPLGGALFAAGRAAPFLFDAVTYGLSFVALLFVRPALQTAYDGPRARLRHDIAEGIAWLWRQTFLRTLAFLVAGWNFISNALVLALIVRAHELGASPADVGVMLAFLAGGAIVGSLIAPAAHRALPSRLIVVGATWVSAAAYVALVPLGSTIALGLVIGASAVVSPIFNVVVSGYRYALTPDRLQARAVSAARVIAWGAVPFGSITAGVLLEAFGATWTLGLLAGWMVLVAGAATVLPSVRAPLSGDAVPA